jgi:hypothetical protein
LRPSWIFGDEEIAATGADYLALGHCDRPMRVGNGVVPAFYSGSPELCPDRQSGSLDRRRGRRHSRASDLAGLSRSVIWEGL